MKIITPEIEKHNADDLCSEKTCSDKPTHWFKTIINNVELFITLCDKHAGIIEVGDFEELIEAPVIECVVDKDGNHYSFFCK